MPVVEMKVPVIGESINEVTLSQWLKPDGSYVKLDEPICEFESDKATLEFPAEAEGKLIHVAKEGDDLEIGALVARIDTSVKGDQISGSTSKKEEKAEAKAEAEAEAEVSPPQPPLEGGGIPEQTSFECGEKGVCVASGGEDLAGKGCGSGFCERDW